MQENITSDDVLGKIGLDSQGEMLGIVTKLHISNSLKKMTGITIDQGFMKPDMFVGMEYIKQFGVDAVLLKTFPFVKLKGYKVFSASGKDLGAVVDVYQKNGNLMGLTVKKTMSKPVEIKVSEIKEIGSSIVLK